MVNSFTFAFLPAIDSHMKYIYNQLVHLSVLVLTCNRVCTALLNPDFQGILRTTFGFSNENWFSHIQGFLSLSLFLFRTRRATQHNLEV